MAKTVGNISGLRVKGIWKTTNETVVKAGLSIDNRYVTKYYMLAQTANDDTFDLTAHANKDSVKIGSTIVHNMYDLDSFWYHQQAARRHKYPYETKYDYQHIYKQPADPTISALSGQNSLTSMTTAGNTFYAIDKLSTGGHCFVNDEMYKWLLNDNGFSRPPDNYIATMLYYSGVLSNDYKVNNGHLRPLNYFTQSQLSSNGVHAISAIVGVEYNTIYEIPGSIKQDYTKGELIANTFKAKNQFNNQWSMIHDQNFPLKDARQYDGIYSCGPTIWLKYKNNQKYEQTASTYNVYPSWYIQMNVKATADNSQFNKMSDVEVVTAINRGAETPQHKTSLYSLKMKANVVDKLVPQECLTTTVKNGNVVATGIDSEKADKIKRMLKLEIAKQIRKIAETIQPANCQLFSATVD